MEWLSTGVAALSATRVKAMEDARLTYEKVVETAKKAGKDPPKYVLLELIGKGSFGKVYKGKDVATAKLVAVKIIDIDGGDNAGGRGADTYADFMKEVNALKILQEEKAHNINHVIAALHVDTSMWMVTEYCGGGSVATLMKPTPSGLKENFIVTITREVAVALKFVHDAGLIHRDVKCGNVLVTEDGQVQLCDFGVASINQTKKDKRTTFIGTPHWMAPEVFEENPSYGKEVDIWALGSFVFEMATGLPPNARSGVRALDLGLYLKSHIPRLDGDQYSEGLKDIIAGCLQEDPLDRPSIDDLQRHPYIANTETNYPTSSLIELVRAFKKWEEVGGSRISLFMQAPGPSSQWDSDSEPSIDQGWNFSTTDAFDDAITTQPQDVLDVYGNNVEMAPEFNEPRVGRYRTPGKTPRRRPPPEALAPLVAPLEKIFDPNTISSYENNSRQQYRRGPPEPSTTSDLALRDDTAQSMPRESVIDLGEHDAITGISSFRDVDTLKADRRGRDQVGIHVSSADSLDYSRPSLSDPAAKTNKRGTLDWKFPTASIPASANPETVRFPPLTQPSMTPGIGDRPSLVHHVTEPIGLPQLLVPDGSNSPNRMSLIDLDMSIPSPSATPPRPSTADSAISTDLPSADPFHWARHASLYPTPNSQTAQPNTIGGERFPSLYAPSGYGAEAFAQGSEGNKFIAGLGEVAEISDFSTSDSEAHYNSEGQYQDDQYNPSGYDQTQTSYNQRGSQYLYDEGQNSPPTYPSYANDDNNASHTDETESGVSTDLPTGFPGSLHNTITSGLRPKSEFSSYTLASIPPLLAPPSAAVMSGTATKEEMHNEAKRLLQGLDHNLSVFKEIYSTMSPSRNTARNSTSSSGGNMT